MSNGTFLYTLEQQAAHFAQFSKAMERAREKQVPPERVTDALQAILGDDEIVRVPKVATTQTGRIFHVIGNFGSAAEALDAGNYDSDSRFGLAKKPVEIPLIIQPVNARVRAVPLGRTVMTGELFDLSPRIVDPMTALTFGATFPEEQREAPHFTLWKDANGGFWYVILNVNDRKRGVNVNQDHPDDKWNADCRVLVRQSFYSPPF